METAQVTPVITGECQMKWHDMSEGLQMATVASHQLSWEKAGVKRSTDFILRLFNLGSPTIIHGKTAQGAFYCRIAPESLNVMNVIIKNYL